MKLYGHPMSNHALRVQALMELNDIPYEFEMIDFDQQQNKTPNFLQLNPNGKVPVIDDDGYVLWESHAIMRYLADKHGLEDWYPKDYKERAHVDMWLDWCHTRLNAEVVTIAFNTFLRTGATDKIAAAKDALKSILPILEGVFVNQDYLCGKKQTIADLSLLSSLMYLPMCGFDLSVYPAIYKWQEKNFPESPYPNLLPPQG